jgi:hypothetical protein
MGIAIPLGHLAMFQDCGTYLPENGKIANAFALFFS